MILNKSIEYFRAFSKKDIKKLENMFSDNVSLRDWQIYAKGIEKVLEANSKIFNTVNTISVNIIKVFISHEDSSVIAELEIIINTNQSMEKILVTDILEFDKENKIKSIRAYKG